MTARYLLVFAFLFATALALYTGSIVGFVIQFLPLTMSGLGVIVLLGRFWKRATWQGALAALVTTPVVSLVGMGLWSTQRLPGTLAGALATVVGALALLLVSLLTAPNPLSFAEVAALMARQRLLVEGNTPGPAPPDPCETGPRAVPARRGADTPGTSAPRHYETPECKTDL